MLAFAHASFTVISMKRPCVWAAESTHRIRSLQAAFQATLSVHTQAACACCPTYRGAGAAELLGLRI
jgi:hypothetical protein